MARCQSLNWDGAAHLTYPEMSDPRPQTTRPSGSGRQKERWMTFWVPWKRDGNEFSHGMCDWRVERFPPLMWWISVPRLSLGSDFYKPYPGQLSLPLPVRVDAFLLSCPFNVQNVIHSIFSLLCTWTAMSIFNVWTLWGSDTACLQGPFPG